MTVLSGNEGCTTSDSARCPIRPSGAKSLRGSIAGIFISDGHRERAETSKCCNHRDRFRTAWCGRRCRRRRAGFDHDFFAKQFAHLVGDHAPTIEVAPPCGARNYQRDARLGSLSLRVQPRGEQAEHRWAKPDPPCYALCRASRDLSFLPIFRKIFVARTTSNCFRHRRAKRRSDHYPFVARWSASRACHRARMPRPLLANDD